MQKVLLLFICLFGQILIAHPQSNLSITFSRLIDLQEISKNEQVVLTAFSVSSKGDIYILDRGLHRILKTDNNGIKANEIGGFGWDLKQFDQPMDIWSENSLDVYIADYNNGRIQRFDRQLNLVSSIVGDEVQEGDYSFSFPIALAVSTFGDLFFIEEERNRVLQFDELGKPVRSFGDFDDDQGKLDHPISLAINQQNHIFVLDVENSSVVHFDYYGNFLHRFSLKAPSKPSSIIAKNGLLLVVCPDAYTIEILGENGEPYFILNYGKQLARPQTGAHDLKADICVQGQSLYVLDNFEKKIAIFEMRQEAK